MNTEYSAVRIATYNMGQEHDTLAKLLRSGATGKTLNPEIEKIYGEFHPLHEAAMHKYHAKLSSMTEEQKKKVQWYDSPAIKPGPEVSEIINPLRTKKTESIFNFIHENCDVVLLQEVKKDIEFMEKSLGDKFDFAFETSQDWEKNTITDAVVCWDKSRFVRLEIKGEKEISSDVKLKAIAVRLQEISSYRILDIASIHAPGYSLMSPKPNFYAKPKPYLGVLPGNNAVEYALKIFALNKGKSSPVTIVAGDFNSESNPTYYNNAEDKDLSQQRFNLLRNKKFSMINHGLQTCYNSDIAKIRDGNGHCDLDQIFIKKKKTVDAEIHILTEEKYKFELDDVLRHPSDHNPIFFELSNF